MPKQKIDSLLSSLREQFATTATTPETEALLNSIRENTSQDASTESYGTVKANLDALAVQMEAEHPTAAKMIRETLKALENMGI